MTAERDLWIAVLQSFFEDIEEALGMDHESARSLCVDLLEEAMNPSSQEICNTLDINYCAFLGAIKREVSKIGASR